MWKVRVLLWRYSRSYCGMTRLVPRVRVRVRNYSAMGSLD